nr:uncharacterized protein DDB_G0271670 [Aedes albopictus]
MKQYIQSQLNLTGLGRGPRKRSHHFSDADIDFYKRIKEFNTTQSTVGSSSLANSDNASSVSNAAQSHDHFRPDMTMDVSELSDHDLQVDDPMASFERPVDHSNDQPTSNAVAGGQDRSELGGPSNAKDYNVLMDDPRGYITAHSSYPHRPAKTTTWDSAFIRHRGYVYFLLSFSLIGAVVLGLFGAYRCLRVAAIRVPAPEALALPIQFLGDDLAAAAAAAASAAPLNADPNHLPVPMLSVQSPGYAGMERLGVPTRSSISSPPLRDERSRRLRADSGVTANVATNNSYQHLPNVHHHSHHALHHHDHLLVSGSSSNTSNYMNNHSHQAQQQQYHQPTTTTTAKATTTSGSRHHKDASSSSSSSGSSSSSSSNYGKPVHHQSASSFYGGNNNTTLCSTSVSRCPHHVALPDGERGPDRDLQTRSCQDSEIPRTYVKAPPNKTVRDVPAHYQSGASSTSSSMSNLNSHLRGGASGSGAAMSHSLSGGAVGMDSRATVNNSLSALGSSGSNVAGSNNASNTTTTKPKSVNLKDFLRTITGNKSTKTTSGISISNSNNNNINGTVSSNASCNNNNYRNNPYGNGSLVGSSGSRSGLSSSNSANHVAVSGIHNHNHHYRQSIASSVQQRQHHHHQHQQSPSQSGLSSSVPNASSGSSLGGGSNTPMSLSASPSPDTSSHYM